MLRRILIPLDPSPYTTAALEYGCHLAKRYDAELTGLVVLDAPGILASVPSTPEADEPFASALEFLATDAREHARMLLQGFREKCSASGVASRVAEAREPRARPSSVSPPSMTWS